MSQLSILVMNDAADDIRDEQTGQNAFLEDENGL
jgi:hypothetical protein